MDVEIGNRRKRQKATDLQEILSKLLVSLKQKDKHGFFSVPVDAHLVPDYYTIIHAPMDLSTMQGKITAGCYSSIQEFKQDFDQIIINAKLYNRPDTIYYQAAEALSKAGKKIIEKEASVPDSSIRRVVSDKNLKQSFRKSVKKSVHYEDLEDAMFNQVNPDGTLVDVPKIIPKKGLQPIQEYFFNSDFATRDSLENLEIDNSIFFNKIKDDDQTTQDLIYLVHGNRKGKQYADSLLQFTENCSDKVKDLVKRRLNIISADMYSVLESTRNSLKSNKDTQVYTIYDSKVDISKEIEQAKRLHQFDELNETLGQYKTQGESASALLQPLTNLAQTQIAFDTIPNNQLLRNNAEDFQKMQQTGTIDHSLLEKVRMRLLYMISRGADSKIMLTNPQQASLNTSVAQMPISHPIAPFIANMPYSQLNNFVNPMIQRPLIPQTSFRACMDCGQAITNVDPNNFLTSVKCTGIAN